VTDQDQEGRPQAGASTDVGLRELSEERPCPKCKAKVLIADPAWAWVVACEKCNTLLAVDGWKALGRAHKPGSAIGTLPEARSGSYGGLDWLFAGAARMRDPEGWTWWEILLWSPASGERRWVTATDGHYLMELPPPQGEELPDLKDLGPGAEISYAGLKLTVPVDTPRRGEKGTVVAITGTLDCDLRPGQIFYDIEAYSPPFALGVRTWRNGEPEVGLERWIPPKHVKRWLPVVAEVADWAAMESHKAEPLWHTLSGRLLGQAAFLLGLLLLLGMGLFGLGDGRVLLGPTSIRVAELLEQGEGGKTLALEVDGTADEPVLFDFAMAAGQVPPDNFWVHVQIMLLDAKDEVHYVGNLSGGHYSGVEGGESWSEGSRRLAGRLTGLKPGTYKLALSAEVELWGRGRRNPPSVVRLEIRRAAWAKGGAYFVAALMLILSLLVPGFRALRRSGVTGSDDDED